MTAGSIISAKDLEKLGWINTGATFGYSQIWKKGDSILLYNHEAQRVNTVLNS